MRETQGSVRSPSTPSERSSPKRDLVSEVQRRELRGLDYAGGMSFFAPRVQQRAEGTMEVGPSSVRAAAAEGVAGSGGSLPYQSQIQASFGRHDVSDVQAYGGSAAAAACESMGAAAYATGSKVAFGGSPSLHTAAHEAAHVVQQRGGVQLKGGVGQAGDRYEEHADAVADLVVQGKSAESLLDTMAGSGGASSASVQQQVIVQRLDTEVTDDEMGVTYVVRYQDRGDGTFLVEVPGGMRPGLLEQVAKNLDVTVDKLHCVNAQTDAFQYRKEGGERKRYSPKPASKVKRAATLVAEYLARQGFDVLDETEIGTLLERIKVPFFEGKEWEVFAGGAGGLGTPAETEGITGPGKRGERAVGINADNHTLGAIVHELFHALESNALQGFGLASGLVEGITEVLARRATGLSVRVTQAGGTIYTDNVRVVERAIALGAVTMKQLLRAYLLGDKGPLDRLVAGWEAYSREHEKVAFLYTGKLPTDEQIEALWRAVDKALGG